MDQRAHRGAEEPCLRASGRTADVAAVEGHLAVERQPVAQADAEQAADPKPGTVRGRFLLLEGVEPDVRKREALRATIVRAWRP